MLKHPNITFCFLCTATIAVFFPADPWFFVTGEMPQGRRWRQERDGAGAIGPSMALPDVMNGLFYARGEARLQASLNPFVKEAMMNKFETADPDDPHNKEKARQQQATAERLARAADLQHQLDVLGTPSTPTEISEVQQHVFLFAMCCKAFVQKVPSSDRILTVIF